MKLSSGVLPSRQNLSGEEALRSEGVAPGYS